MQASDCPDKQVLQKKKRPTTKEIQIPALYLQFKLKQNKRPKKNLVAASGVVAMPFNPSPQRKRRADL